MANKRVTHRFGGVWTEIKLKALTEYLGFYQTALKKQSFDTWYIDAFAGTGFRNAEVQKGGIFESQLIESVEEIYEGSALKALRIQPPFNHYFFIEQHHGRGKALAALKDKFKANISIRTGEANAELKDLFLTPPWSGDSRASRQRGVVFLDPYGMSVDWATLRILAQTKRVDVWYLFPRKAVVQQLAHDIVGVDDSKRRKLSQIFGTDDWENELYANRIREPDLFQVVPVEGKGRVASPADISAYAQQRLKTLFCYVSPPLPLLVKGQDFFELYCLSDNQFAIDLIKKGVEHVIKKYTPASRRKYVR